MTIEYSRIILDKILFQNGIRSVELAMKVMEEINPQSFDSADYNKELKKLVDNRDIIQIEYRAATEGVMKRIYFTKGTSFCFNEVGWI